MAKDRKGGRKPRRERKNIPHAVAHIHATFNNTIVTFTDPNGASICWSSGGRIGYKGSRKGTPYAAQLAARNAAEQAQENGVRSVDIRVKETDFESATSQFPRDLRGHGGLSYSSFTG